MSSGERHQLSSSSSERRQQAERRPVKQLLTEQELRGMIAGSLSELAAELAQGKSERLQQYLDFAARFHTYSRANQFLIYLQRPDATRVASYKKWADEGFQVAKGETGIRILAPSFRKQINEETGEEEQVVCGFIAVSVFDVQQLTPDKRPSEYFVPLDGDQEAFCQHLIQAASTDGFEVAESDHTNGAEGYSSGRQIVTRRGQASTNKALTLIHEYAHGLLHQGHHELAERRALTRELKECHAEATAYVVARHFGLPTPFSSDYLLTWSTTPDTLKEELDAVVRAASHIISKVHALTPGEAERHDGDTDPGDF